MILAEIILRLRKECDTFKNNVAGSESFFYARDKADSKALPLCLVVPLERVAEEALGNATAQRVVERFATIFVLDNSIRNIKGKDLAPSEQLELLFGEVKEALMNWEPAQKPRLDTIRFVRGFHLDMSNARVWHQFEWQTSYFIDSNSSYEDNAELIDQLYYEFIEAGEDGSVLIGDYIKVEGGCPSYL